MLYWNANFQIANSGTQCRDVYAFVEEETGKHILVKYYGDTNKSIFLKEQTFVNDTNLDSYNYLLTLEEFKSYQLVD